MQSYRRIALTVKSDLPERDAALREILSILRKMGAEVCVDARRCGELESAKDFQTYERESGFDLLLIIGGDGTILRAVRELTDFSVPILTVNRGAVGFLAEMTMAEAEELLPSFLSGDGVVEERSLLHVVASRDGEELFSGCVLNDAVISQGSIARLVNLRTLVNDEELTTFRSDGLIIATPTGSTAYSLAAGGPILHPELSAIILSPINSYSFSQKPIVIPGHHTVEVEVLPRRSKWSDVDVSLTLDGQRYLPLKRSDRIRAHINAKTVKFLRRHPDMFYGTIRKKLRWGERV